MKKEAFYDRILHDYEMIMERVWKGLLPSPSYKIMKRYNKSIMVEKHELSIPFINPMKIKLLMVSKKTLLHFLNLARKMSKVNDHSMYDIFDIIYKLKFEQYSGDGLTPLMI